MRLTQALDLFVPVPRQPYLNLVITIADEGMRKQCAAARAHRKPIDVLLLSEVRPHPNGVAARRTAWRADWDIVKPMTDIVLGQQRGSVNIQPQKIADGILVFGAVEPAKSLGPAGIRVLRSRAIQRGSQPGYNLIVTALRRPILPQRRHL